MCEAPQMILRYFSLFTKLLEKGADINPTELGRKNAHKPFALSNKQSRELDRMGHAAWMEYAAAKAKAEGKPRARVWI